jgi:hypothetical protein
VRDVHDSLGKSLQPLLWQIVAAGSGDPNCWFLRRRELAIEIGGFDGERGGANPVHRLDLTRMNYRSCKNNNGRASI